MQTKCWKLERIVEEVYREELDALPDENTREVRKWEHYESARKFLNEIFELIGFDVNFLKKEGGYANRGTYMIPALDYDLFEELIEKRNDKFFKIMKTGRFYDCDQEKLSALIDRLCEVLKHLEVDFNLIQYQRKIMEQKTYVYMGLPFKRMTDINNERMSMICEILTVGSDLLSHDEICEFLSFMEERLDLFYSSMIHEFRNRNQKKEEEMKKTHIMMDVNDFDFSKRTNKIMDILEENPEFVSLREERKTLVFINGKMTAQRRKANEKRLQEIDSRMSALFKEVASKEPVNVSELTPIEQYMMLCGNEGFRMYMCQEEKKLLLYQSDRYYLQHQMQNTMYLGDIKKDNNEEK